MCWRDLDKPGYRWWYGCLLKDIKGTTVVLWDRTAQVGTMVLVLLAFNRAVAMEQRHKVAAIVRNQHIERDKLFDQVLADAL